MTTAYIYSLKSKKVVETITAESCKEIEDYANYDCDNYGLTYSPAFGCVDGLKSASKKSVVTKL